MSDLIQLKLATVKDAEELHDLQVKAFLPLYEKYGDEETSPAKESLERITWKIAEEHSDFYFILHGGKKVGGVRVSGRRGNAVYENIKWISPIFIVPEWQNKGIASKVIENLFQTYPDTIEWRLDTVKQETGNCHLYEKCGFVRVGEEQVVNENMTLVDYVKSCKNAVKKLDEEHHYRLEKFK